MQVLLVNGTPITLEGEEGLAIKECLLKGAIPNQDLINHLLIKAGLLLKPVKVSTELTVKDTRTKTENVILHRNGTILDEKSRAGQETQVYSSATEENWLPVSSQISSQGEQLALTGPPDSELTAGKSLRDRLQSSDSVHICDEGEVTGGVRDSQDSLAGSLDRSFDTQEAASCGSSTSSGLTTSASCSGSATSAARTSRITSASSARSTRATSSSHRHGPRHAAHRTHSRTSSTLHHLHSGRNCLRIHHLLEHLWVAKHCLKLWVLLNHLLQHWVRLDNLLHELRAGHHLLNHRVAHHLFNHLRIHAAKASHAVGASATSSQRARAVLRGTCAASIARSRSHPF